MQESGWQPTSTNDIAVSATVNDLTDSYEYNAKRRHHDGNAAYVQAMFFYRSIDLSNLI